MPKAAIEGVSFYYEIKGKGSPVVFIHGLGSSIRDWDPQIDFFSENYTVITYDLRGHGQSDKPPGPYSPELFAKDTASLIKALDVAPVHIGGLSMGAQIAIETTLQYPETARSLFISNCNPHTIHRKPKKYFEGLRRIAIIRFGGMLKLGEHISNNLFPLPEQEERRKLFVKRWGENDKRAYMDAFLGHIGWTSVSRLHTIKCPALIVGSDGDITTPIKEMKTFTEKIPHSELQLIEGATHAAPMEKPDEFNEILDSFLKKI